MKAQRLALVLIAVGLVLIACTSGSRVFPRATRTTAPTFPAYPRNQREEVRIERGVSGEDIAVTTLHTTDSFNTVVQFYRDQLVDRGWQFVGQRQGFALLENAQACPIYSLQIIDKSSNQGVGPWPNLRIKNETG